MHGSEATRSDVLDARRLAIRRVREKRAFRRHLSAYSLVNLAFWLSWVIDGVREEWLAPWPLVPTLAWGVFLLYRVDRLGGRRAISRATIDREAAWLRESAVPAPPDQLAIRPIVFSGSAAYRPIRPFHLREIIEARNVQDEQVVDLRNVQDEQVVDLRNVQDEQVVDLRNVQDEQVVDLRNVQDEQVVDLREPRPEREPLRSVVEPRAAEDTAKA